MTPTRHRTLATIRACDPAPPTDSRNVLFFVLADFGYCRTTGRKIGMEWVARDPANMSRRETLIDIRSGELPNVVQILEVEFTAQGISSRDVTEDMLAEVEITTSRGGVTMANRIKPGSVVRAAVKIGSKTHHIDAFLISYVDSWQLGEFYVVQKRYDGDKKPRECAPTYHCSFDEVEIA